jgi:hypothetical protein
LYQIEQQQQQIKLVQKFPKEHSSSDSHISCLLQVNSNTIVSSDSSDSSIFSAIFSPNVIVIWSKSKSSSLYEPLQRIKRKEAGGDIRKLVLLNPKKEEEEEEFASCSYEYESIIIWRRGKGDKEMFRIKQKIRNVNGVLTLLYIPLTNELIFGSFPYPYSYLQIWSPSFSSSSSSDFVERQKIETCSSWIWSLCQINRNDTKSRRIEFASGHWNGQIKIWSKQINESNHYSLIRTLKAFDDNYSHVDDLIFLNYKGLFDCLIACCKSENKIKIFKGEEEEEEEELKDIGVRSLIPMSNGQFASGGDYPNECLNIWTPSSSSSS